MVSSPRPHWEEVLPWLQMMQEGVQARMGVSDLGGLDPFRGGQRKVKKSSR